MLLLAAAGWLLFRLAAARASAATTRFTASAASLDAALLRLSNSADSQARFVGNLAQELETPLATALIHADLLLTSSGEPATLEFHARSVAEDMRHLSELVESFLRLAHPFAQEDISHHLPVAFHDVVLEAARRCQALARSRAVSVVPNLAESGTGTSVEVLGDAVLLESMIANLVRNAVLAAPRGTRVDLRVSILGEEVVLSVRDHGADLDDERLASVFAGFFPVPPPTRPVAGTGLGLAIAKRVAEHHRGSISLRKLADGGCMFEVQLPRWRA